MYKTACSVAEIKRTGDEKGLGVFALQDIPEGWVVEVSPVVLIEDDFESLPVAIQNRIFAWGNLSGLGSPEHALALGWGGMFNHGNPASLRYCADPYAGALIFTAVRAIRRGEELTINYNLSNGDHISTEDTWFEDRNIRRVD